MGKIYGMKISENLLGKTAKMKPKTESFKPLHIRTDEHTDRQLIKDELG